MTIDSDINRIDWSKVISSIDMDIYIRRYDMTAQPDSAGNYPLKEEESIKGKYDSQAEQQTASNQSKHENSDTNYSARLQNNIEASQISDSSLGTGSVFNLNWLWLFIVPVVIFLFIKKVKNKK
ncbi:MULTISPECIES: hypothetical protein [unclassified Dysgonomonas]|uniref:hypothetical protein n=1 Tax=unclassified Dysgonomonas TaxID=2630389 RepID=UPI002474D0DA|nr:MULTISPECIES: hypothetical protein [unclassified Dysgonomonas]